MTSYKQQDNESYCILIEQSRIINNRIEWCSGKIVEKRILEFRCPNIFMFQHHWTI